MIFHGHFLLGLYMARDSQTYVWNGAPAWPGVDSSWEIVEEDLYSVDLLEAGEKVWCVTLLWLGLSG